MTDSMADSVVDNLPADLEVVLEVVLEADSAQDSVQAELVRTAAVVFLLLMALQAVLAHCLPATAPQVPADRRPVTVYQALPVDLIKRLMKLRSRLM